MTYSRVGVVTGANKGIGLAIVRQLALQFPKSPLSGGGASSFLIYLTARDDTRGKGALERIQTDEQLKTVKALSTHGGRVDVAYHALDISDPGSVGAFAKFLADKHGEGLDFVINNAAIAMQGFGEFPLLAEPRRRADGSR